MTLLRLTKASRIFTTKPLRLPKKKARPFLNKKPPKSPPKKLSQLKLLSLLKLKHQFNKLQLSHTKRDRLRLESTYLRS